MFITIKANSQGKIENFVKKLKDYEELYSQSPYVSMLLSFKGNKITIYNNLTITVEGRELDSILRDVLTETIMDEVLYIGSDEVGIGEAIGPIIVCGLTFKNLAQKEYYFLSGVIDSKKMKYHQIMSLGKRLENDTIYKCITVSPESFNNQYSNGINVKLLNAVLHNKIHHEIGNKIDRKSVLDQFVNEKKYYEYLATTNETIYQKKIIFKTKGESEYLEIAGAAILAKYKFNKWVEKILQEEHASLAKYIKNSVNYTLISKDVKNKTIAINPNKILKKWER